MRPEDARHERPLKIYNASAGSGKTYHLVKEYILFLIRTERETTTFANVIAMTFTNKAALEMKERIIAALDQLSSPTFFDRKSKELATGLADHLGISTKEVSRRSKVVLKSILHRYEDFNVLTIDKFNLRLIKSFVRDLDLPSDFEVILDETEIIERIVDDLMNRLGTDPTDPLSELMMNYARSNIEDGQAWNFRRNLIQFGHILNSEKNKSVVDQLLIMDLSVQRFYALRAYLSTLDEQFRTKLGGVRSVFDPISHVPKELPGGGHTVRDIQAILKNDRFPVQKELVKKRLEKNLEASGSGKTMPDSLKSSIWELTNYWEKHLEEYATITLFLKNFFNMALLQYMALALKERSKEEQIIRISEFNTLISELIQNESAPFIYERLGTRFHHFLLDEFQDTSRLQWLNLVPLVHDSIAQNKENLIVGDPKQSIYRFKNGIAEQFVALPAIYNPEKEPTIELRSSYFLQMGKVAQLENNWRSSPAIVDLNNRFFEAMKTHLPEEAKSFYENTFQHAKSTAPGRILISSKEEKVDAEALIPTIVEWIRECENEGYTLGEITILGGTNRVCNIWAVGLNALGYKVVSNDSLLIHSSIRVQVCIAFLKRRLKPSGVPEMKRFAELYFRSSGQSYGDYQQYLEERTNDQGGTYRFFNDVRFLDDYFGGYHAFFFKHESVYDLLLAFYRLMDYQELNDPYLHHLADIAFDHGIRRGPDLTDFLEEYDTRKGKIAVNIPLSSDAIQVMTIHKSKGLEFPVVMIPSFDFRLSVKSSFLLNTGDFVLYKQPSKNEILDNLATLYTSEEAQIITDCFNLCYVAMTRPTERLYIQNSFDPAKFGRYVHQALTELTESKISNDICTISIHQGAHIAQEKQFNPPSFIPKNVQDYLWFPQLSLQDSDHLKSSDLLDDQIQFGIQFHTLIGRISSVEMIREEIEKGIQTGEISMAFQERLYSKLSDLFTHPKYLGLFENATEVLSEQALIVGKHETIRPDKIIVKANETILLDFKTGIPSGKDVEQVLHYRSVLQRMNYPNVRCILIYTALNEFREFNAE